MKKSIGFGIAKIGGRLWEKGGFWFDDPSYENLSLIGKIGYNLMMKGFSIAGLSEADVIRISKELFN